MKNIFYLFVSLTLVFTSCNPLEDIDAALAESTESNGIVGDVARTLSDEDYSALDLSFPNFSSTDNAKSLLPDFLSAVYPALGVEFNKDGSIKEASSAAITYNIYFPKRTEKSLAVYEVTAADYAAAGHRFGNFSSFSDISEFLDSKYPSAANRMLVNLTYKYYNGASTVTLENGFIIVDGTWEMNTGITQDEYTSMGQNRAQFNNRDQALAKLPIFAKTKFQYDNKQAGDIEGFMYKLYVTDTQDIDGDGRVNDRAVYSFLAYFIFDGSNWLEYENLLAETLQFGHNGTTWVPDNTIKYTLTNADFALVDNARYNNFDIREGRDEETIEARLVKINTILKANFPSAEEGQKFSVTYAIYDGANGTRTTNVIKEGTDYILQ